MEDEEVEQLGISEDPLNVEDNFDQPIQNIKTEPESIMKDPLEVHVSPKDFKPSESTRKFMVLGEQFVKQLTNETMTITKKPSTIIIPRVYYRQRNKPSKAKFFVKRVYIPKIAKEEDITDYSCTEKTDYFTCEQSFDTVNLKSQNLPFPNIEEVLCDKDVFYTCGKPVPWRFGYCAETFTNQFCTSAKVLNYWDNYNKYYHK